MEVTHYQDEEEFLNSAHNNIEEWTPMTGESLSVDGKEWFRQKRITNTPKIIIRIRYIVILITFWSG